MKKTGDGSIFLGIINSIKNRTVPFLLFVILTSGCAIGPRPVKQFISPSQALYDRANAYFLQRDYGSAIAAYEKFIKNYPSHKLIPGAYLGLAWSEYLLKDYAKSLEHLAQVRTQDKNLKDWIEKLSADCKKRISETKEITASALFNIPQYTRAETIKIEGALAEGSKVLINNREAKIENGIFSQEVQLEEGENIISIGITDKDGKTETKDVKVTLDRLKPVIKVTSAELDDFGYVEIIGETEKGSKVFAEDEPLSVDAQGKFKGQIKLPFRKQIKLSAEDLAGNSAEEIFYDSDYPDKPTGLRVRSIYGQNVDLEWNSNREKDIKGYNIYYSRAGDFSDLKRNTEVIKDIKYTFTGGLESGSTYTMYIRAVDKMGNESQTPSESVTVTMP